MSCICSVHFCEIVHGGQINLNGNHVFGGKAGRVENREKILKALLCLPGNTSRNEQSGGRVHGRLPREEYEIPGIDGM